MADQSVSRGLAVSMFTPWHIVCGVRDYTAHLVHGLDSLSEIDSVRIVAAPTDAVRSGRDLITHYRSDAEQFRALGRSMNPGADVAHVQHQYFLFGGVAP